MVGDGDGMMICGKGMNPAKRVPSHKKLESLPSHRRGSGGNGYILVKSNDVDWLRKSRKVEPVEPLSTFNSSGNRIVKEVKKWLKGH